MLREDIIYDLKIIKGRIIMEKLIITVATTGKNKGILKMT